MRKYLLLPTLVTVLCIFVFNVPLFSELPKLEQRTESDQSAEQKADLNPHLVIQAMQNELKNKSTPELFETLGTGDPSFRTQVMIEIGKRFGGLAPTERENMIRSLNALLETEPEREKRVEAAACLGLFINFKLMPDEREQIAEGLRKTITTDHEPTVVLFTVRALPDFDRSDKAIDTLLHVLNNQALLNKEPKLLKETFLSLGKVGEVAIPILVGYLNDFPEEVLMGLSFTKSKEALQIIEESSRSKDSQVRYHAVHALGLLGSFEDVSSEERRLIKKALSRALRDKNRDVRKKAVEAMGMLRKTE